MLNIEFINTNILLGSLITPYLRYLF